MTELELMLSEELYIANDEELRKLFLKSKRLTREYNNLTEFDNERKQEILKDLFGKIGENSYIEAPLRCDYGCNTYIGKEFYANYDLIILDIAKVEIGNNCMFGPRCMILSAAHPIDKDIRNEKLEYGKHIKIGNNCWFGGGVIINPGVEIGDNVVIGSGSVVTKNIPSNVIAVGNPCKVLRKITEDDKKYWESKKEFYIKNKK